jgi:hypothetical protein
MHEALDAARRTLDRQCRREKRPRPNRDAKGRLERTSLEVLAKRSYESDLQLSARYSGVLNELVLRVMEGAV